MSGNGTRRAWGWHALTDDFARQVVADAEVRPGELVLDIGAGEGAITAHLVAAGAQVVAVELHAGRAERLRTRFADAPVTVAQVDIADLYLPHRPFRVVANPPFGVTRSLVGTLLGRGSALTAADLVLQRGAVDGLAARRLPRGVQAARWQVSAGRPLPRKAFSPPPRVDARVLVVRRR